MPPETKTIVFFVIVITTAISLGTHNAFGQFDAKEIVRSVIEDSPTMNESAKQKALALLDQPDIILLSHRYNEDRLSDEIVGEVVNNSTIPYDKYNIDIVASFYDSTGQLVGSEQGFIDANSLNEGDRSAFDIFISNDAIRNEAITYDVSINDDRMVEGASKDAGSSNEESNNEEEEEDEE